MPKDIRFGELVKTSGKPEVISLWTDPKENRSFMKAVKENRVLTLIQEPTSKKKDFGRIGFHQEPYASYLIFPRPLPTGTKPRVIGIKYDLVEQPRVSDPVDLSSQPSTRRSAAKPPKASRQFTVLLRRQAVIETTLSIEGALSEAQARKRAARTIAAEPFDLSRAVFRNEVLDVSERTKT